MKLLFVSDVHYKKEDIFLEFLKSVYKKYDEIYIVGDLFEFYFGYSFLFKQHLKLIELLSLISKEKKVYLFEGNHEYRLKAIKKFLPDVDIIEKELIKTIDSKLFYIDHGDRIDRKDRAYIIFRNVLKNRFTLKLIEFISPVLLLKLADAAAKFSKRSLKNKQHRRTDLAIEEFATQIIQKGYDYVIFAHTHNPIIKKINSGVYANIGDFCEHFTYLEYDKSLYLKEFNI